MCSCRFQSPFSIIRSVELFISGGFMKKLKKARPAKKATKNKKSGLKLKRLAKKRKLLKAHAK